MFLSNEDKMVNTDSVTNIVIEGNKVIFNLDYGISLQGDDAHIIADYVYMIVKDPGALEQMKQDIKSLNWIDSNFGAEDYKNVYRDNNRVVNPDAISFVKFDNRKSRIIFNLRSSVSFKRNIYQKTSDFVYYDHSYIDDFEDEKIRITNILKEL